MPRSADTTALSVSIGQVVRFDHPNPEIDKVIVGKVTGWFMSAKRGINIEIRDCWWLLPEHYPIEVLPPLEVRP